MPKQTPVRLTVIERTLMVQSIIPFRRNGFFMLYPIQQTAQKGIRFPIDFLPTFFHVSLLLCEITEQNEKRVTKFERKLIPDGKKHHKEYAPYSAQPLTNIGIRSFLLYFNRVFGYAQQICDFFHFPVLQA